MKINLHIDNPTDYCKGLSVLDMLDRRVPVYEKLTTRNTYEGRIKISVNHSYSNADLLRSTVLLWKETWRKICVGDGDSKSRCPYVEAVIVKYSTGKLASLRWDPRKYVRHLYDGSMKYGTVGIYRILKSTDGLSKLPERDWTFTYGNIEDVGEIANTCIIPAIQRDVVYNLDLWRHYNGAVARRIVYGYSKTGSLWAGSFDLRGVEHRVDSNLHYLMHMSPFTKLPVSFVQSEEKAAQADKLQGTVFKEGSEEFKKDLTAYLVAQRL